MFFKDDLWKPYDFNTLAKLVQFIDKHKSFGRPFRVTTEFDLSRVQFHAEAMQDGVEEMK